MAMMQNAAAVNLTVVVLNWNRPEDTIKAVGSVLRQRHAAFDVLIWDNQSTDDSRGVLERQFAGEPRVRMSWGDGNYGVAGGRNRAFRIVTSDIIVSLDSDAILEQDDALQRITEAFQQHAGLGLVSFEVRRPDGHVMWPFSRPLGAWRDRTFETYRCDGCAFAVRREVFEKVGGFPEHFSPYGVEDAYFAIAALAHGWQIHYLPGVRVVHDTSSKGRWGVWFVKHVRNHLWLRIELFPMPQATWSAAAIGFSLFRDAVQQKQVADFLRGAWSALAEYRRGRRHPISREVWRRLRDLVNEEKRLGKSSA